MPAWIISLPLLLAVAAPPLEKFDTPSTRLFVRTVPDGAEIFLDGEPLGKSDGLFLVSPGVRKVTIELDGYSHQGRELTIESQRITRVELDLRKERSKTPSKPDTVENSKPSPTAKPASDAAFKSAVDYISQADIPAPLRETMLTVLRQHLTETRWSGQNGATIFAVAAKSLPSGKMRARATPALLELAHSLSVHELLKAKSLLDQYSASGLSDATTLRSALEEAAGKLHVTGEAQGVVHQAAVRGEFVVAYVHAEESALTTHLLQPAELEKVQIAYRDVMHRKARELMERSDWENALLLWQHLHQRKLVSQQLYLDAAQCFKQLGRENDTVRILSEAVTAFAETGSPEFFEQAGDVVLDIETDAALELAEKAYVAASEALMDTVSTLQPEPNDGQLPDGN